MDSLEIPGMNVGNTAQKDLLCVCRAKILKGTFPRVRTCRSSSSYFTPWCPTTIKTHSTLDNSWGPNTDNPTHGFPIPTTKDSVHKHQLHQSTEAHDSFGSKVLPPSPKVSNPWPPSQVNAALDFKLLDRALAGAVLKLATVDMGDKAVDFYCKHAVLLGDYYVRKDKSGKRAGRWIRRDAKLLYFFKQASLVN